MFSVFSTLFSGTYKHTKVKLFMSIIIILFDIGKFMMKTIMIMMMMMMILYSERRRSKREKVNIKNDDELVVVCHVEIHVPSHTLHIIIIMCDRAHRDDQVVICDCIWYCSCCSCVFISLSTLLTSQLSSHSPLKELACSLINDVIEKHKFVLKCLHFTHICL